MAKKPSLTPEAPFKLEGMDLDEALERFAGVPASEAKEEEAKGRAVQLVRREGEDAPPFLLYSTDKGLKLELRVTEGEPWFTQAQMAALFGKDVRTINEHIQKYIADGELDDSVIRKFRITAADGKSYDTNHYALDVAFYVGFRVNSRQGAMFRRWATDLLIRFAKHGYAMDVERLKAPEDPGIVDQLKEIIRVAERLEGEKRSSRREALEEAAGIAEAAMSEASRRCDKSLWGSPDRIRNEIAEAIRQRAQEIGEPKP